MERFHIFLVVTELVILCKNPHFSMKQNELEKSGFRMEEFQKYISIFLVKVLRILKGILHIRIVTNQLDVVNI